MILESVKAMKNRIDTLFAERTAEIADIEATTAKATEEEAKAKSAMEEATERRDTVAYQKAKQNLEIAQDTIEMNKKRLTVLNSTLGNPLISEEEYKTEADLVKAELAEQAESAKKKLIELAEKMLEISQEYKQVEDATNAVLLSWQRDIYHSADRPLAYDWSGALMGFQDVLGRDLLKVENPDIRRLGTIAVKDPSYNRLTGRWYDENRGQFRSDTMPIRF